MYATNHTCKIFRKNIIVLVLNIVDSFTLRVPHKRQHNNYLHGIELCGVVKSSKKGLQLIGGCALVIGKPYTMLKKSLECPGI